MNTHLKQYSNNYFKVFTDPSDPKLKSMLRASKSFRASVFNGKDLVTLSFRIGTKRKIFL